MIKLPTLLPVLALCASLFSTEPAHAFPQDLEGDAVFAKIEAFLKPGEIRPCSERA